MTEKKEGSRQISKRWNAYVDSGKYKEALAICDSDLKLHPSSSKAWERKGMTFFAMNKYDKAIAAFNTALKLKSNDAIAWHAKGQVLIHMERDKEALEAVNQALEIRPSYAGAWVTKGRILGFLGRHVEALQAMDMALQLRPNDAHTLVHKGETLAAMGRRDDALRTLDEALKIEPRNVYAIACRAETLQALGRHEDALRAFDEALKLEPNHVDVLFSKALALANIGNYEEASRALDAVLLLKPENTNAWYEKGRLLLGKKHFPEALSAIDEALKLDPRNSNAWVDKATILLKMERLNEALDASDHATNLEPKHIDGWARKAAILSVMERYDEALAAYDKALKLKPDYWQVWLLRAMTLLSMNRIEDALRSVETAIQLKPDEAAAVYLKGLMLAKLNKLQSAVQSLAESAKLAHAAGDHQAEQEAHSFLTMLNNRIREEADKIEPPIETKIIRKVRASLRPGEDDPLRSIKQRVKDSSEYFDKRRTIKPTDAFLLILRRWNSFTPSIPNRSKSQKGGGYFLAWKDKGVVIDPGFDFLNNFDDAGFSIDDIDAIVITHAHIDHTADLEKLLCLKHELAEHRKDQDSSKVDLFMNLGSANKFIGWVSMLKLGGKVITLNAGDRIEPQGYSWTLEPTFADHSEVIGKNCLGLVFHLKDGSSEVLQLGITGDTAWRKQIENQYKKCKLLCVHLGSIQKSELDESLSLNDSKRMYQGEHLGLRGTINIIKSTKPQLSIITEFGEELGNNRCHVANSIDNAFGKGKRCLTGDIGLKIRLPDLAVYCSICDDYRDYTLIQERNVKGDLFYPCQTHTPKEFAHRFAV